MQYERAVCKEIGILLLYYTSFLIYSSFTSPPLKNIDKSSVLYQSSYWSTVSYSIPSLHILSTLCQSLEYITVPSTILLRHAIIIRETSDFLRDMRSRI